MWTPDPFSYFTSQEQIILNPATPKKTIIAHNHECSNILKRRDCQMSSVAFCCHNLCLPYCPILYLLSAGLRVSGHPGHCHRRRGCVRASRPLDPSRPCRTSWLPNLQARPFYRMLRHPICPGVSSALVKTPSYSPLLPFLPRRVCIVRACKAPSCWGQC